MFSKEIIKQALQTKVGTVIFTKADGSERTMRCTLQESFLPAPVTESTEPKIRGNNPDTLSVWDVEAEGWRSFRIDSIISTDI